MTLKEIGMPEDGIDRAADQAVANPYWNPRAFDRADIRRLIETPITAACLTEGLRRIDSERAGQLGVANPFYDALEFDFTLARASDRGR